MVTEQQQKKQDGKPVLCDCGKILAFEKNGNIYIYCKRCKRQFPIKVHKIVPRA